MNIPDSDQVEIMSPVSYCYPSIARRWYVTVSLVLSLVTAKTPQGSPHTI